MTIGKHNIRNYLDAIFELVHEYWRGTFIWLLMYVFVLIEELSCCEDTSLVSEQILQLVEKISLALKEEVGSLCVDLYAWIAIE